MRNVSHKTSGHRHGAIVRLMSPSDLGQMLKPFVFLDFFNMGGTNPGGFSIHPHSGIATLTYLLSGDSVYEDTTGKRGVLKGGGVEWMQAGSGVWHNAAPVGEQGARGFQLWMALPPELENAAAESQYIAPDELRTVGPASVLLGQYGEVSSTISVSLNATYLAVRLRAGESWTFEPPAGQTLGWMAVGEGSVDAGTLVSVGEMVVFEESSASIEFKAKTNSLFVLGSAVPYPHELVLGTYSVHSSREALRLGEAGIARIGHQLRSEGRL